MADTKPAPMLDRLAWETDPIGAQNTAQLVAKVLDAFPDRPFHVRLPDDNPWLSWGVARGTLEIVSDTAPDGVELTVTTGTVSYPASTRTPHSRIAHPLFRRFLDEHVQWKPNARLRVDAYEAAWLLHVGDAHSNEYTLEDIIGRITLDTIQMSVENGWAILAGDQASLARGPVNPFAHLPLTPLSSDS